MGKELNWGHKEWDSLGFVPPSEPDLCSGQCPQRSSPLPPIPRAFGGGDKEECPPTDLFLSVDPRAPAATCLFPPSAGRALVVLPLDQAPRPQVHGRASRGSGILLSHIQVVTHPVL